MIKIKLSIYSIEFINNHKFESISKSQMPVPIRGGCPSIILLLGVLHLSLSHLKAASVMNLTDVSKVILKKGLALYFIQFLFIAFIFPPNVT